VIGVSYSYFIYPVVVLLLSKRKAFRVAAPESETRVSLIVAAHNEAASIREKIENSLALTYSYGVLEILIASDGSTDDTNAFVKSYADKGVILIDVTERKGKENAQLQAIRIATGDILVFSDVATILEPDAIDRMIEHFAAPDVGAVSSEDVFISDTGKVAGEGLYVRYEMWLRNIESNLRGVVGLSGSFFAARKAVCALWDLTSTSDFTTALSCMKLNYRAISAAPVKGYYKDLADQKQEYHRKYRTVLGGIVALWNNRTVLNVFKYGLFSFEVWGHKVMRWMVPWFMLGLLIVSMMLYSTHYIYSLALILQLIFYSLAFVGLVSDKAKEKTVFNVPYFFMVVNVAITHATLAFFSGKRITIWTPSKR